jgi:hypothetical protein
MLSCRRRYYGGSLRNCVSPRHPGRSTPSEKKPGGEHLLEPRTYLGLMPFGPAHFRQAVHALTEIALQTDKGFVLEGHALDSLRAQHVIVPALDVVERVCAEAITRANPRIYAVLTDPLSVAELLHLRSGWEVCR